MEIPTLLLTFDDLGREILPGDSIRVFDKFKVADRHNVRHKGIEEPSLLGTLTRTLIVVAEFTKLLACFNSEFDAAVPEHLASFALVNLRVHVK